MYSTCRMAASASAVVLFAAFSVSTGGCKNTDGVDTNQDASFGCEAPDCNTETQPCRQGEACGPGMVCVSDGECVDGCFADGSYHAIGDTNPSNACEVCTKANETDWTAQVGAVCDQDGWNMCDSSGECIALHGVSTALGTCGLTPSGGAMCWGISHAPYRHRTSAALIPKLESDITAISMGGIDFCAITSAGGVLCGSGAKLTVECWSDPTCTGYEDPSTWPVEVAGPDWGIVAVSSPATSTLALTAHGAVVCWGTGCNGDGATTLSPVPFVGLESGIAEISAIGGDGCALTDVGGVLCWGHNDTGQLGDGSIGGPRFKPEPVLGLESGVVAISRGWYHSCALMETGGVMCWGSNGSGQLGDGTPDDSAVPKAVVGLESGVAQISAGKAHTCVVTTEGAAMCWGAIDIWGSSLGIYDADYYSHCRDGWCNTVPMLVAGFESGVAAISAGEYHTCAEISGQGVVCFGCNDYGQLGSSEPVIATNCLVIP